MCIAQEFGFSPLCLPILKKEKRLSSFWFDKSNFAFLHCVCKPSLKRKVSLLFPADSLVHFHVLLVAEAASRGDQLGAPLHFNQELSEGEEEEGS